MASLLQGAWGLGPPHHHGRLSRRQAGLRPGWSWACSPRMGVPGDDRTLNPGEQGPPGFSSWLLWTCDCLSGSLQEPVFFPLATVRAGSSDRCVKKEETPEGGRALLAPRGLSIAISPRFRSLYFRLCRIIPESSFFRPETIKH